MIDGLPLENHLSLVEKIIFQIEHNPIHRVKYINNYLNNPLLLQSDLFLKRFDADKRLRPLIKEYKQLCKAKKREAFIRDTPNFKSALEALRDQLSDKAFEYSLNTIIKKVHSDPVEGFIVEIAYHVNLLVSEFLFTNRSKQDIIDVLGHLYNSQNFPYPTAISGKGGEEKRKYLEQLSTKKQLEAINDIYRKKRDTYTFVCKVYDMGSHPAFEFKPHQVTFISKEKGEEIISHDSWRKERVEEFLNDQEEFILAYLPVSYYSFLHGSDDKVAAIDTIREELSIINHDLSTNGVVDTRDYLLLDEENKTQGSGRSNIRKVDANSVDLLESKSAYVHLTDRGNAAKAHILRYESYLSKAKLSRRVADYWHYLEIIITNAFPGERRKVEGFLPSILLVNHLYEQEELTQRYIMQSFYNPLAENYRCWGVKREQWVSLRQKALSANELLAETHNPFAIELDNRYISKSSVDAQYYCDLKDHYKLLLTEAYEQRNAYQHAGYECEKATIKLRHTIHHLVIRFRRLILERADVSGEISFAEILTCLKKEGEQLYVS
ncbi:MAG: hypothetical protein WA960_20740 [Tunicatimonas sp.]